MTEQTYQRIILDGLQGLPPANLAEIVDFVYFVRKRVLQPQAFAEELHHSSLWIELRQLSYDEEAHLEEEFTGYEQLYRQPLLRTSRNSTTG